MRSRPPRPLRFLAGLVLPARNREFVLGDLEEMFGRRAARHGRGVATARYVGDALASSFAALSPSRGGQPSHALPEAGPVERPGPGRLGSGLPTDIRMAVRSMRREPGFVALAVFTLALGVGSSAAGYGMIDQLLLRPLPGTTNGDEAAYLQFRSIHEPGRTQGRSIALLDFDEVRRSATLLDGIASFGNLPLKVSTGEGRPIRVSGQTFYGDFFETLGAWPAAGRLLTESESMLGADPLQAVISEDLAGRLFGSVAAAPGNTVRMNDESVTVVGVAGGGFAGPERNNYRSDVWLPHGALVPLVGFTPELLVDRNSVMHGDIIIRPRPGVTQEAVIEQMDGILAALAEAQSANEQGPYLADLRTWVFPGLHVPPLVRSLTYSSLRMLAIVVSLVLVLACANVANLLLFRNVKHRGAVATLRALGASTGRIARQHLVFSLFIGLLGAVAGIGIGWLISIPFKGSSLVRMPAFEGLGLHPRVLLFALAACGLTTLLFGTLPALVAGRFDLADSSRSSSGKDTGNLARIRSVLSAVQLSLGMALLVGALLLIRTMRNIHSADLGIDPQGVAVVSIDPPADLSPEDREILYRRLLAAVRGIPEVEAAAGDSYHPFGASIIGRIRLPGAPGGRAYRPFLRPVTPGWFEILGVQPVYGRTFQEPDWISGRRDQVILTESLANHLFGRTDVVGQVVEAGFGPPEPREIIGIVSDIRSAHSPDETEDSFFLMPAAVPTALNSFTILAEVGQFSPEVAHQIRTVLEAQLPDEPIPDPEAMSVQLDAINGEARTYSRLLTMLSVIAVILSAVGLYAVVAFTVAGRKREFGVRLALGAGGGRIAHLVARNVLFIVGLGTAMGLGAAMELSDVLQSRLFGVTQLDPTSYAAATVVFALVAVVASWRPTTRAIRVDPAETLREE